MRAYYEERRKAQLDRQAEAGKTLVKLQELMNRPPVALEANATIREDSTVIQAGPGVVILFPLDWASPDIKVARAFCSANAELESHIHEEREIMAVVEGSMRISIDGDERTVSRHDAVIIEPNVPHAATFPEVTWLLTVTLPSSPLYPGSKPSA